MYEFKEIPVIKRSNLEGLTFGRLTVISFSHKIKSRNFWRCVCLCGATTNVDIAKLNSGHTRSCGCLARSGDNNRSHGMYGTPTYLAWAKMKARCYDKKSERYSRYGGRGIIVCAEWLSFEGFYKDMGDKPKNKQIDRIDNDGDYTPENCQWTTALANARNKSYSKWWFIDGVRYESTGHAAKELGVSVATIFHWCNGRRTGCYSEKKYGGC